MRGSCPHCGKSIEMAPEINGATIVYDAEERDIVISYPSGYVKMRKGYLVHKCEKTGDMGHVVR